ncbi:hypothetical protein D3C81_1592200 [compost metagenome]
MAGQGVGGGVGAVLAGRVSGLDQPVVHHHAGAGLHGVVDAVGAKEAVVGPPGGTDHAHRAAVSIGVLGHGAVEQRHVGRCLGRLGHQTVHGVEVVLVVLVVAGHVDHRHIEGAGGPVDAVAAVGDVAGQDHEVRRARGDGVGLVVLQVDVAEDAQLHGGSRTRHVDVRSILQKKDSLVKTRLQKRSQGGLGAAHGGQREGLAVPGRPGRATGSCPG